MFAPSLAIAILSLAAQEAGTITPAWSQTPMPFYPEVAMARGINAGEAQLNCTVLPDGRLKDCRVVSETPRGAGFGAAALTSLQSARVSEATVAQAASGVRTQFTIRFRLS